MQCYGKYAGGFVPERPLQKGRSGFTLLELMMVIAVIGILAGILLPAFSKVRDGARLRQAEIEVALIGQAIAAYKLQERGRFPASEAHHTAGVDRSYGEGETHGNREVMYYLRYEDRPSGPGRPQPVIDVNQLLLDEAGNALNPWGVQYSITLDLDYNGEVNGSQGEYRIALNQPD